MALYFLVMAFVFGLAMGSFLNCLAWRLYHGQSLWGRSQCPKCDHRLRWYDNIPLLGYLNLRGRCRDCQQTISPQYFWLELVSGLLFLSVLLINIDFQPQRLTDWLLAAQLDWRWLLALLRDWTLLSGLIAIFLMDWKWYVIADEVSLTTAALVLIFNLVLGVSWQSLLIGIAVGAGLFIIQHLLSGGAWVGSGDIRMGVLMGAALAWPKISVALILAYCLGALWGIGLVLLGKKKMDWRRLAKRQEPSEQEIEAGALPFGTFLAVATVAAFHWGQPLIDWYLNLILI